MTEAFLHQLFERRKLGKSFQTTTGDSLEVLSFGTLNKSSGPDFLEATVKFDDKIWAGNIEFHIKSSDWLKHKHQDDKAYNNVVAHFVYEHDQDIYSGEYLLPVVELKDQIIDSAFDLNGLVNKQGNWIPCQTFIKDLAPEILQDQLKLALDQRLKRKKQEVLNLFRENTNDQKKVFLLLLAKTLGGKYNSHAMETLVSKIELTTLAHIGNSFHSLKTYVLGMAGIERDSYFNYLQYMYQFQPMSAVEWKTSGMRPASQPKKRLLQLAAILHKYEDIDLHGNQDQWRAFFSIGKYESAPALSNSFKDLIMINAVTPFLLAIAWLKGDKAIENKAMLLLESLQPEKNSIIKSWTQIDVNPSNAFESQALIELKNEYCNEKKCLICSVGKNVLGQ